MDKLEGGVTVELDPAQLDLIDAPVLDDPADKVEKAEPVRKPAARNDDEDEIDIEALKREAAEARAEAQRLQAEVATARREAAKLSGTATSAIDDADQAKYETIHANLRAAQQIKAKLKDDLAIYSTMGDHDRVAEIHVKMAEATVEEMQQKGLKQALEARFMERKAQAKQAPSDPVEAQLAHMSERSAAWMRAHPDCLTDPRMNAKVVNYHYEAKDRGIPADSAEYFRFIEDKMGFSNGVQRGRSEDYDDEPAPRAQQSRDSSTRRDAYQSPPVSRDSRAAPANPKNYKLSAEQAGMAQQLGMTPTEYATWLLKAERDGKYQG